jgi:hypothetical protein
MLCGSNFDGHGRLALRPALTLADRIDQKLLASDLPWVSVPYYIFVGRKPAGTR